MGPEVSTSTSNSDAGFSLRFAMWSSRIAQLPTHSKARDRVGYAANLRMLTWLFMLWAAAFQAAPAATADTRYIVRAWGTDDGLPQNTVTTIIQTRDGYLWAGT